MRAFSNSQEFSLEITAIYLPCKVKNSFIQSISAGFKFVPKPQKKKEEYSLKQEAPHLFELIYNQYTAYGVRKNKFQTRCVFYLDALMKTMQEEDWKLRRIHRCSLNVCLMRKPLLNSLPLLSQ